MLVTVSDVDLLARMRNFEDHFVERKTSNDTKDILKTIIAFANSAPVGSPAVLYIGVLDSGEIETPQRDLDKIQKRVNSELQKSYPRVSCIQKIVKEGERQALAVIVHGSENRPHFAGPSYIRSGSENLEASEEHVNELIASRNSKVSKLLAFKGKPVSVINRRKTANNTFESSWGGSPTVHACNQFFVTIAQGPQDLLSFPLSEVEISFDNAHNQPKLILDR